MNIMEAMTLSILGKVLKRKAYMDDPFYYSGKTAIRLELSLEDFFAKDWEVISEPPSH